MSGSIVEDGDYDEAAQSRAALVRRLPNREDARRLLHAVIAQVAPGTPVEGVDAGDPEVAVRLRYPGLPTIRVEWGIDRSAH